MPPIPKALNLRELHASSQNTVAFVEDSRRDQKRLAVVAKGKHVRLASQIPPHSAIGLNGPHVCYVDAALVSINSLALNLETVDNDVLSAFWLLNNETAVNALGLKIFLPSDSFSVRVFRWLSMHV